MGKRVRKCSICGGTDHDRRSCSQPIPLEFPKKKVFDPWLHLEWGEHSYARKIVAKNPDGMTLEAVGEELGITRERVRQIEVIALAKLRGEEEAGITVDFEGRTYPAVECSKCGELFIRDGAERFCEECQPDPIPKNIPSYSLGEKAARRPARVRGSDTTSEAETAVRGDSDATMAMFEELFDNLTTPQERSEERKRKAPAE